MFSPYEFCPNCQGLRKMSVSIALKTIRDVQGVESDVLMVRYHCDTCLSFVRQVPVEDGMVREAYPTYMAPMPSIPTA
jgi:hypothetical protein